MLEVVDIPSKAAAGRSQPASSERLHIDTGF